MEMLPVIPGYKIEKKIGEGATASVFMGIQEKLKRKVAIKILKPSLLEDSNFASRFLREAEIAAGLKHPNIVTIHDVGQSGNYSYIIMEYLEVSLKDRLRRCSNPPLEETIKIVKQIAGALEYAQSKGVLHRDIKPANILFREDGTPVIVDFGLARNMDASTNLTVTGVIMGTPRYMSPEQCRGERGNGASDIYSLGVVMFEMLTGNVPYCSEIRDELLSMHINAPVPRLPDILNPYQPLIDRLMAKDKEQRLKNGKQIINLIDALEAKRIIGGNTKNVPDVPWLGVKKMSAALPLRDKAPNQKKPVKRKEKIKFLKPLFYISIALLAIVVLMIFVLTNTQGGAIESKIIGNADKLPVRIELSSEPFKFTSGDNIDADIYYTLDGSEPTKEKGSKYTDTPPVIQKDGTFTLKARVISKDKEGKYKGPLYSRAYTIDTSQPPQQDTIGTKYTAMDSKYEMRGGGIHFEPGGGLFSNRVMVQLSVDEPLRFSGEEISGDIYYTLDGSEPTKYKSQKYEKLEKIVFSKPGKYIIKAKSISRVGKYEGDVYSQTYTLQQMSSGYTIETVTNLANLDQRVRDNIFEKTKKIVITVEGISKIRKSGMLAIQFFISSTGKSEVSSISGIVVEPKSKLSEIEFGLRKKIQNIDFLRPTRKGLSVNVKIWIDFEKIGKLENKITFLR